MHLWELILQIFRERMCSIAPKIVFCSSDIATSSSVVLRFSARYVQPDLLRHFAAEAVRVAVRRSVCNHCVLFCCHPLFSCIVSTRSPHVHSPICCFDCLFNSRCSISGGSSLLRSHRRGRWCFLCGGPCCSCSLQSENIEFPILDSVPVDSFSKWIEDRG